MFKGNEKNILALERKILDSIWYLFSIQYKSLTYSIQGCKVWLVMQFTKFGGSSWQYVYIYECSRMGTLFG